MIVLTSGFNTKKTHKFEVKTIEVEKKKGPKKKKKKNIELI